MSEPELTVGRGVIADLVRLAAFEVPGVARVGHAGPVWRQWLAGPPVSRARPRRPRPGAAADHRPTRPGARAAQRAGAHGRRRDRGTAARSGPRRRHGHRRWRRRLTASGVVGPGVVSPWPRSSRPISDSARRVPSWSGTWPNRSGTRLPPTWPATSSRPWSRTATRSTRRSPGWPRSTPSPASRRWTAHCSEPPSVRCYTPARRPGWPSPSGSSWHAPTVETRCDAS